MKIYVPDVADPVVTILDVAVEIGVSGLLLVTLVGFHGLGLTYASAKFSQRLSRMSAKTSLWRVQALMTLTVGSLLIIHLIECMIWALPIYGLGITHTYKGAFSFTFECYTTLGLTPVIVPAKYDILPPMISVTGLFTFGWTGSSLVYVMAQILRLEQARIFRRTGGVNPSGTYRGPFGE